MRIAHLAVSLSVPENVWIIYYERKFDKNSLKFSNTYPTCSVMLLFTSCVSNAFSSFFFSNVTFISTFYTFSVTFHFWIFQRNLVIWAENINSKSNSTFLMDNFPFKLIEILLFRNWKICIFLSKIEFGLIKTTSTCVWRIFCPQSEWIFNKKRNL